MSMLSRFAATGGGITDPYWSNVSLLLVGNGINGTTTNIKDSSSNNVTLTPVGNTVISTAQSKFGSGSVYFDGNGDYITIPNSSIFNLSGSSYTIEGWIYPTGVNTFYRTIIAKRIALTNTCAWEIYLNTGNGILSFYNGTNYASTVTPTTNAWNYFAAVYNGTNITLYLNGTNILSSVASNVDVAADIIIGSFPSFNEHYDGYIYDLRVTKGVARYTGSTMTVPTAPFPIG